MTEEKINKKRKGKRPKKVISFRIDGKEYENNKTEIRKEVENAIKRVINKNVKKEINKEHRGGITKYYDTPEKKPEETTVNKRIINSKKLERRTNKKRV